MFSIDVKEAVGTWTADLDERVARQVPFATSLALNRTARDVREYHQAQMPAIFDRPTRYTINSLQLTPATKQTLAATLWFKSSNRSRQHYLTPQVKGGPRLHKAFEYWLIKFGVMAANEFAVPASGMKLNAYGNISPGVITSILSQLKAGPDATQFETSRSRKKAGSSRYRYFVPSPTSNLKRGIWRRRGKSIEPVLLFVGSPSYQKRYPLEEMSLAKTREIFPLHFDEAMIYAMGTASPRV